MMQLLIKYNLEIIANTLLFGLAITSALLLIIFKNPIYKILMFLLTLIITAIIWIILNAEFLAMLLILLYIASSIVLFLFAVMMLDVKSYSNQDKFKKLNFRLISSILISLLFAIILIYISKDYIFLVKLEELKSNFLELSLMLLSEHILFFSLIALVLLLPMIAVICINIVNQDKSKNLKVSTKQTRKFQLLDLT
ncbi:MAG: NADH-quinone oxidoreductase subunit J family protein [Gammaproteobacteria bacterium]